MAIVKLRVEDRSDGQPPIIVTNAETVNLKLSRAVEQLLAIARGEPIALSVGPLTSELSLTATPTANDNQGPDSATVPWMQFVANQTRFTVTIEYQDGIRIVCEDCLASESARSSETSGKDSEDVTIMPERVKTKTFSFA